jgi:hypothetical protein
MTAPEKIKARVRKLLSLAESQNVNEAAVAAAAAQGLIDQHNIDVAMLDGDEEVDAEPVNNANEFSAFDTKSKVVAWKWALLWAICEVNDCKPWSKTIYSDDTGYRRHFYAVGRPDDCAQVVALYRFVEEQIEYLAKNCGSTDRSYRNSFRHGAGAEVSGRLKREWHARRQALTEAAEEKVQAAAALTEGDGKNTALVLANTALVRAETAIQRLEKRPKKVAHFMEFKGMKYSSGSSSMSGGGFGAGRRAGQGVRTKTGQKSIG